MIDKTHLLPVTRQARLLGLARSSVYYESAPVREAAMAAMDDIHMTLPFYGIRRIRNRLRDRGLAVERLIRNRAHRASSDHCNADVR